MVARGGHCTVALYGSREDAEEAEDAAIKAEQPQHNVQGALDPERPRRRAIRPTGGEAAAERWTGHLAWLATYGS